jgi:hypothetical protein
MPSAKALHADSRHELGELLEIALISRHDEIPTECSGGDDGRVYRVGSTGTGEQLASAFSELRRQRLDSTAF